MDSKRRGNQNVDFPGFYFLEIPGGDFRPFGQFVLRQSPARAFAAHIRTKNLDSLPFFLGKCHDTLHRFIMM